MALTIPSLKVIGYSFNSCLSGDTIFYTENKEEVDKYTIEYFFHHREMFCKKIFSMRNDKTIVENNIVDIIYNIISVKDIKDMEKFIGDDDIDFKEILNIFLFALKYKHFLDFYSNLPI